MYELKVYSKQKMIANHRYPIEQQENAENAAYALRNFPRFKFRTELTLNEKLYIGYESDK